MAWEEPQLITRDVNIFTPKSWFVDAVSWRFSPGTSVRVQIHQLANEDGNEAFIGTAEPNNWDAGEDPADYDRAPYHEQRTGGNSSTFNYSPTLTTNQPSDLRIRIPGIAAEGEPGTLNGKWEDSIIKTTLQPQSSTTTQNWYDRGWMDVWIAQRQHEMYLASKPSFMPSTIVFDSIVVDSGSFEAAQILAVCTVLIDDGGQVGRETGDPDRVFRAGYISFARAVSSL